MATSWLKAVRQAKGWTQHETARRLGVSQPYLSLLEQGRRPLTKPLLQTLQRHLDVPPQALPPEPPKANVGAQRLAQALGALGYPGFAYLKRGTRWHPAQVLLTALQQSDLETRLAEALPWLVLHYPNLEWDWLLEHAKVRDLQNRLGFVVVLARQLAERQGDTATVEKLLQLEERLERARLVRQDTLGRDSMTASERRWLQKNRSAVAEHWNLLSDLTSDRLPYAS